MKIIKTEEYDLDQLKAQWRFGTTSDWLEHFRHELSKVDKGIILQPDNKY